MHVLRNVFRVAVTPNNKRELINLTDELETGEFMGLIEAIDRFRCSGCRVIEVNQSDVITGDGPVGRHGRVVTGHWNGCDDTSTAG